MKYVIKKSEGNYFKTNTDIGPCFGATRKEAFVLDSAFAASAVMVSHSFAFADCEIEKVED